MSLHLQRRPLSAPTRMGAGVGRTGESTVPGLPGHSGSAARSRSRGCHLPGSRHRLRGPRPQWMSCGTARSSGVVTPGRDPHGHGPHRAAHVWLAPGLSSQGVAGRCRPNSPLRIGTPPPRALMRGAPSSRRVRDARRAGAPGRSTDVAPHAGRQPSASSCPTRPATATRTALERWLFHVEQPSTPSNASSPR